MLDEIEQQMNGLGIDTSTPQPDAYADVPELTDEELAMFWPWGQYDVTGWEVPVEEPIPMEQAPEAIPEMPAYDIEELKIDISPMLSWLPKEQLADLVIWIWQERTNLNSNNQL